jgi:hypothetical protein
MCICFHLRSSSPTMANDDKSLLTGGTGAQGFPSGSNPDGFLEWYPGLPSLLRPEIQKVVSARASAVGDQNRPCSVPQFVVFSPARHTPTQPNGTLVLRFLSTPEHFRAGAWKSDLPASPSVTKVLRFAVHRERPTPYICWIHRATTLATVGMRGS